MKIHVFAAGRLRNGPERELVDRYRERFDRIGQGIGIGPVEITEYEPEAGNLKGKLNRRRRPVTFALDERGQFSTSPEFAQSLARWRDRGVAEAIFLIGGAKGLPSEIVSSADVTLSFGKMVFPHMLARVILAEQLYRAASILAGTRYHKE